MNTLRQLSGTRYTTGAVATFYHLRRHRVAGVAAAECVRRWSKRAKELYVPHPLDLATTKHLTAYYARPNHHTGD